MKKDNLKENVGTGISSTIGAAVGVVGGTLASDEIHAEAVTPAENGGFGGDSDEDVQVIDSDPSNAPTQNPANTPTQNPVGEQTPAGGQTPAEPSPQPTPVSQETTGNVQVVAYETVTNEDGSQSDVAVLSDGTSQAIVVDVNQDGVADVMAMDVNHDGHITEDEVVDISGHQMAMQPLHDAAMGAAGDGGMMAQNASEPDYVNNANVDSYMA